MSTEQFLAETFIRLVKGSLKRKEITNTMCASFMDRPLMELDELEIAFQELEHAVRNKEFYSILERIEKGERLLEQENDFSTRQKYIKRLRQLAEELEKYMPGA